ncbi:hypothetical protein Y1Q_0019183 [Alligator mississippiensis]|uniref:Uncharacterized protein n=1 Tax=Alligator mississippiensis TaxID=8496 RepID=A0A151MQC2_ALLMI|nr:hypothetical protein Y1Q_0019183 [Alligator mississippiensis]
MEDSSSDWNFSRSDRDGTLTEMADIRTMFFMQQLDHILAMRDPGHSLHVYSSTGGLLEPPPGPSSDK